MFNLPYKFRQQTEYCTPKGPSIKWAPWLRFSVNGTEIKLKVPRHTIYNMDSLTPRRRYTLNSYDFNRHVQGKIGWEALSLLARGWRFNGPWFIGSLARLNMYAMVITPTKVNESISFFHPRALESGIADYLTYRYGDDFSPTQKDIQSWLAPMNWRPLINHPCLVVSCDALGNKAMNYDGMDRFLFFPVSDQHILAIKFHIARANVYIHSNIKPESDKDKWVNSAPMEQLATDIINSLNIILSPEAKQQQEKALMGLADKSLVKEFPPLKWTETSIHNI